jgi:Family of unknown function (DUF6445)
MTEIAGDLFQRTIEPRVQRVRIGDRFPALVVDDFYQDPDGVRDASLCLSFQPAPYEYPGRIANLPPDNVSLVSTVDWIRTQVNTQFLPHAPLACNGRRIEAFDRIHTDMALTETHPEDLSADQRKPHTDPVPVFGLVYLNREERGGTLFFEAVAGSTGRHTRRGYPGADSDGFRLIGRLAGSFNRLVIYPGIVPHSGEVTGDWIRTDARFECPRLTQRFAFFPAA